MPNRTPDTPGVGESELGRMKVAQLREHARERGIAGADELRKPELLAAVKDWHRAREHGGAKGGGAKGGGAKGGGAKGGGAKGGGARKGEPAERRQRSARPARTAGGGKDAPKREPSKQGPSTQRARKQEPSREKARTQEPSTQRAPERAAAQRAPQDGDGPVGHRLNLLEAAVRDLGKNLNALVRALRSTIGR